MDHEKRLIAHNIRKHRKKLGYSQEVLAEKADLDRTFISEIENEKKNVTLETLFKLSIALEIKVRDLFSEEI